MRSHIVILGVAGLGAALAALYWSRASDPPPGDTAALGGDAGAGDASSSSADMAGLFEPAADAVGGFEDFFMLSQPRGIRNNNPGNLRPGSPWQGLATPQSDGGPGGGYLVFQAPYYGLRALAINLRNQQVKHGLSTIDAIITKYAPASDSNDTRAYVGAVAREMGVPSGQPLNLSDAGQLADFMRAVVQHENGQQPYDPSLIDQAARAAVSQ